MLFKKFKKVGFLEKYFNFCDSNIFFKIFVRKYQFQDINSIIFIYLETID